jgi:hypothetical protein
MSHASVAKSVRLSKAKHPENFCPVRTCLYRTGGGECPNHLALTVSREEMYADWLKTMQRHQDSFKESTI